MRRRLLITTLLAVGSLLVAVAALAAPSTPFQSRAAHPAGSYHVSLLATSVANLSSKAPDSTTFRTYNDTLGLGHSETDGFMRILVRFDLSGLPPDAQLATASLRLAVQYTSPDSLPATAYRVTSAWDEAGASWNTMSGQSAESFATAIVSKPPPWANWISWDVLPLAQLWVTGNQPNYGVQLRSPESQADDVSYSFISREMQDWGPRLEIDYTGSPMNTPTVTPSATPTATDTPTSTPAHRVSLPMALNLVPPTATPTPRPTAPPSQQLLVNGGFEDNSGWVLTGGSYTKMYRHGGERSLRVCDSMAGCQPGAYQTVTLPASATGATLRYYWVSLQPQPLEYLAARVKGSLNMWMGAIHQNSYGQQFQLAEEEIPAPVVAALRGQTVELGFYQAGDGNYPYATFYVDDVTLTWW